MKANCSVLEAFDAATVIAVWLGGGGGVPQCLSMHEYNYARTNLCVALPALEGTLHVESVCLCLSSSFACPLFT